MDAAQRDEILTRYREHAERFDTLAARRPAVAEAFRCLPGRLQPSEQALTAREIEVLQLCPRRGPVNFARSATGLPLRGKQPEPRAPHPGQASGTVKSPRRSGWLPAWAPEREAPAPVLATAGDRFPTTLWTNPQKGGCLRRCGQVSYGSTRLTAPPVSMAARAVDTSVST